MAVQNETNSPQANATVSLCNEALGHISEPKILDFNENVDASPSANYCRRFYEGTLRSILRMFQWPFATTSIKLSEYDDEVDVSLWGYPYAYLYPANCILISKIFSGMRIDTEDSLVPRDVRAYRKPIKNSELTEAPKKCILTTMQNAKLEYVYYNDDATTFPPDFREAFTYRLAKKIAEGKLGSDSFKLAERCEKNFFVSYKKAESQALLEIYKGRKPPNHLLRARQGYGFSGGSVGRGSSQVGVFSRGSGGNNDY